MTDFQPILLYPVRDAFARKQFLTASLVALAGMIVPIIPLLILTGYCARIMRQIIDQDIDPSMLEWQGSNWGELLKEGTRISAVRLVYGLPIILFIGCGIVSMLSSPIFFNSTSSGDHNPSAPMGAISLIAGIGIFFLAMVVSLPLGIIIGAAESHTVAKQSFNAGLRVSEWWPILRNNLGQFVGVYLFTFMAGFVLSIGIQIATITVVLICVVPFLMVAYSTYLTLVLSALFAKVYVSGRKALQATTFPEVKIIK